MGGLISRRSHPPRPDTPPQRTASALTDEPDEPGSPAQSPETVLRERMEAKRLARQKSFKPVPDTITPVRIRDRLARFLEEDFGSPQAMQAAIDVYAAEVDLIEREGRMVGRLVGVSSAGSGAPVNEIRSAIESFLDTPAHAMSHSLDETARLLLQADVDLPGGVLDLTHGSAGPNPRSAVPPFTGQMPRTSASDSAFLKSISTEVQLLEAERRVAEQVAETKHRRQQAQLQHHYIQRLMASKKDGEEIEGVLASAKVIREQKDVLRKWQAEQESLNMLKDELHDWEHKAGKANAALMPLLASHRTLKQALDKFVTDEEENQKVVEEFNWLESEERAAASGAREPLTQEESFRLDFLAFKKQSWEDNTESREKRTETEKVMFANIDIAVSKERQNVAMFKSELQEAHERVKVAEDRCLALCQRSEELGLAFSRLPTAKSVSFSGHNPDDSSIQENAVLDDAVPFLDEATHSPKQEDTVVYALGCDTTHGVDMGDLELGFAAEYYYIGEEIEDSGPDLESVKPDATTTSQSIDLEATRSWPDGFPEECVAARWSGFFTIDTSGQYKFSTESNDGSHLWISGSMVVDNGGLHGMRKMEGVAALAAGLHTMKADFFVSSGSPGMIVRMSGPDTQDESGQVQEILMEGYHRKGWESVGAFQSVHFEAKEVENIQTVEIRPSSRDLMRERERDGIEEMNNQLPAPVSRQSSMLSMFGRKESSSSLRSPSFAGPSFFKGQPQDDKPDAQGSRPATKSVRWDEKTRLDLEAKPIQFREDDHQDLEENEEGHDGSTYQRLQLRTAGTDEAGSRPGTQDPASFQAN